MRITRLRANNLRALSSVDFELRPLTVLIGPNGVGKSTVLELLNVFGGIARPQQFVEGFARWGGFAASTFYGADEPRIKLEITAADDRSKLEYFLEFYGEQAGFFVEGERLTLHDLRKERLSTLLARDDAMVALNDGAKSARVGHGSNTTLNTHIREVPQIGGLVEALQRITLWKVHTFLPAARLHSSQQLKPTVLPSADGSDLVSALYSLKTERRDLFRDLLDALQTAVPELEEIEFPLAGAGQVNLTWKQSNYAQPFYANQLSDGILRFLWIMTILHTVPDDGLVMLDEPETSLHPQWLMLLVSLCRKASVRTNVLVATQSAELIRWLEPEELVIADMTDEGTTLRRASEKNDLAKWLEDFTLAELWTMGELGGRQ